MEYLFLLGRVLFAGIWFVNALNHFQNASMMAGYVASRAFPPRSWRCWARAR